MPGQAFKKRRALFRRRPQLRARAAVLGELKFFDTTEVATVSGTAGVIHDASLNLIPQGVTESTRVGRKCTIRAIHLKGILKNQSTAVVAEAENTLRVIVYLDKQANGATAAVTDILETAAVDSFRNLANSGRFSILLDKKVHLNSGAVFGGTAAPASSGSLRDLALHKKCSIPIEFNGATGAIGEIRSNNLGVLSVVEQASATPPTVQYICRVRFSDN